MSCRAAIGLAAFAVALAGWSSGDARQTRFVRTPPPVSYGPVPPLAGVRFVSRRVGFLTAVAGQFGGEGRIERTDDGGNTWRTVWVRPHWRVSWITFAGRLGFAGALDRRGRPFLLRSTDGGLHWSATRLPKDVAGWPSLDVHYLDARRAYAVTDPSSFGPLVFLRSDDGGVTWRHAAPRHAQDVQFLTPKLGFAADGAIWRTDDGGTTWRKVLARPYGLDAVRFLDARHGFAAGGYPAVMERAPSRVFLATDDGGATWRVRYTNPHRGFSPAGGDPFARLHFVDARRGWATTGECKCCPSGPCAGEILTTDDGGRSWRGDALEDEFSAVDAHHAWALPPCGCGVWRTRDGGASWRVLARPGALSFDRVAAVGRTLTLSSWEANSFVSRVSRDGGSSWTPAVHAADAFQLAVSARTVAVAHGAPWLRGVVRIRHAGRVKSFRIPGDSLIGVALASDSVAYVAADVRSLVQSCPDDTPIVAASVWITGDAGGSWRRLHLPFHAASLAAHGALVAAFGVRLCSTVLGVSADGGRTWRVRSVTKYCDPSVAADDTIWLACGLRSRDGGKTWARFHPVTSVAALSAEEAWAVWTPPRRDAARLWHTVDGGRTWIEAWP